MKRKRLPLDFIILKVYLLFYLVVVSFYFSGCATSSASLDESDADRGASLELNCRDFCDIRIYPVLSPMLRYIFWILAILHIQTWYLRFPIVYFFVHISEGEIHA